MLKQLVFVNLILALGIGTLPAAYARSRPNENCLNLQSLFEQLARRPADDRIREVTVDARLAHENLRTQYSRNLLSRAFRYSESDVNTYIISRPKFEQINCREVTIRSSLGSSVTAKIVEASPTQLTLKTRSSESTYSIVSDGEISIQTQSEVIDDCRANGRRYRLQTRSRIVAGSRGELASRNETLAFGFFRRITEGLITLPIEFKRHFNSETQGSGRVDLSPSELELLMKTSQSPLTARCIRHPD